MQQDTTPNWFDPNIQQPYPVAPPPRKHSWLFKLIIIIGIILLLVGGGATGLYFLRPTCLTSADYQQLAGAPYDGQLDATTAFYTALVYFQTNKSTYDNTSNQGETQLKSFAEFYQSHSHSSVLFTLSATYPEDIYQQLTEQRLAAAKQSLIALGVPESLITTNTPKQITPEDEPSEEDTTISTYNSITISITSAESCR